MGDNQSYHYAKKYTDDAFGLLFVYTVKGDSYLLPWKSLKIHGVPSIEAAKYNTFKLTMQGWRSGQSHLTVNQTA